MLFLIDAASIEKNTRRCFFSSVCDSLSRTDLGRRTLERREEGPGLAGFALSPETRERTVRTGGGEERFRERKSKAMMENESEGEEEERSKKKKREKKLLDDDLLVDLLRAFFLLCFPSPRQLRSRCCSLWNTFHLLLYAMKKKPPLSLESPDFTFVVP